MNIKAIFTMNIKTIVSQIGLLLALALFLFTFITMTPGCALLQPAADKVQAGVDSYCQKLTYAERKLLRNSVNPTPNGNNIHIHCLGDPPDE